MAVFGRAAALGMLVLALAGCAATSGTEGSTGSTAPVTIQVQNSARADLDVSLLTSGQEIRLGRVQIGETGRFRPPATLLRAAPYSFSVRLVARDGTGEYYTPQLTVAADQMVTIDASPTLSSSRYEVR